MATSQGDQNRYQSRYPYTTLHSNYHESSSKPDVDVIIRVNGFRIDKHEQSSVAVTLEDRYVEVLIYEKNKKGKVVNRYKCAESTSAYDTEDFTIIYKEDAVILKLKKKEEPWSVSPHG